ncbi:hypothetical protein P7K49_014679, partial [Saguinus oedipus]
MSRPFFSQHAYPPACPLLQQAHPQYDHTAGTPMTPSTHPPQAHPSPSMPTHPSTPLSPQLAPPPRPPPPPPVLSGGGGYSGDAHGTHVGLPCSSAHSTGDYCPAHPEDRIQARSAPIPFPARRTAGALSDYLPFHFFCIYNSPGRRGDSGGLGSQSECSRKVT